MLRLQRVCTEKGSMCPCGQMAPSFFCSNASKQGLETNFPLDPPRVNKSIVACLWDAGASDCAVYWVSWQIELLHYQGMRCRAKWVIGQTTKFSMVLHTDYDLNISATASLPCKARGLKTTVDTNLFVLLSHSVGDFLAQSAGFKGCSPSSGSELQVGCPNVKHKLTAIKLASIEEKPHIYSGTASSLHSSFRFCILHWTTNLQFTVQYWVADQSSCSIPV